ncbi:MAG: hypothetical protein V4660_15640 [Pseudomonadota bacterium]
MSKSEHESAAQLLIETRTTDGLNTLGLVNGISGMDLKVYFWQPSDLNLLLANINDVNSQRAHQLGLDQGLNSIEMMSSFITDDVKSALSFYQSIGAIKSSQVVTTPLDSNGQIADLSFLQANLPSSRGTTLGTTAISDLGKTADSNNESIIGLNVALEFDFAKQRYWAVLHEIGHALGLSHPWDVSDKFYRYDNFKYTMMSYNHNNLTVTPDSPMLLDYLALQNANLLGAYRTGDADVFINANINGFYHTIYDTAGSKDSISAAGHQKANIIDLRDGHFSSYGSNIDGKAPLENLAIAYDTIIENAIGGDSNDVIIGNSTSNELKGGKGDDFIYGNGENYKTDNWKFSDAHKNAYTATVDTEYTPGHTNDKDTIYGGEGNDYIAGESGDDTLYGDEGYDFIFGGMGNDTLEGGADSDHLYGGDGTFAVVDGVDILNGGDGNDILEGGSGSDTYLFTGNNFGRDVIKDSDHNGTLKIDGALLTFKQTAKDSIVYRNETYQAVKVKEGTSTSLIISSLTNSTNSVTIKNWQDNSFGIAFQAPDPQNQNPLVTGSFTGNANANVMTLNEFLKTLPAGNTKTYTQIIANGGIGTDLLQGTLNGSDTLNGGENDDFIIGGNQMYGAEFGAQLHMLDYLNLQGTDQLNGGAGSDYIVVSGKNSVAHGGTENDFIRADEYLQINVEPYEADGGVSSVDDYDVSVDNVWADLRKFLRPQFAETPTGFFLDYIDRGLTSNAWQASQSITGLNYFYLQRASNINANAIIVTTNYGDTAPSFGTRSSGEWSINGGWQTEPLSKNYLNIPNLNIADFQDLQGQHLFGDEGDDVIYGGIMSDELIGGVGDDTLFGLDGHDILDGSEGIDHLRGGTGNDTLIGGDNNDVLQGNGVTLHAAQKNLPDNDTLYGGDGNDELYGGEGKDYLDGGIGSDSLLGEEGNDYLYGGDDEVRDELIGGGNDDIMVMGTSDVAGGGSGNDIYIWNTHQVTKTPKAPASLATTNQSTSNASLADVFIDPTPAVSSIYIIDNEGSDTLALVGVQNLSDIGFDVSDNNILINTGTDQKLMIQGGASSAPMHLVTGSSVEQIVATPVTFATITDDTFLNGSDLLAQPQINTASLMLGKLQRSINVTATTAGSYLTGGLANDTLTAHIGGTRFIGGKSNDVLNGDIGNDNYLIRSGDGNDIIIEKGGINTIKLDAAITANQLTTPLVAHRNGADLLIIISSEQSITVKDMFDMNTGALVAANSIQTISFYDNTSWDITKIKQQSLISTTGDDVIGGFELNDTLKGGKGNDNLNGGAGNDVYQYALGDGNDIIVDAAGTDRIEFASSILQNQVTAFRDAYNNLVLRMVDGAKITVTGAFDAAGNFTSKNIETIQFSDGSWDAARIKLEAAKYTGNVINGTTGSDTRIGDAGKDIFTGGTGNDILSGYAGDDVYQYALGDGNDVITDIAGVDRIVFTAGITQAETKARSNGNDLILTLKDGGTVTVKDMFAIKSQTPVDPAITSIIQQLQTTWLSQAETLIENNYGLVGSGDIMMLSNGFAEAA